MCCSRAGPGRLTSQWSGDDPCRSGRGAKPSVFGADHLLAALVAPPAPVDRDDRRALVAPELVDAQPVDLGLEAPELLRGEHEVEVELVVEDLEQLLLARAVDARER